MTVVITCHVAGADYFLWDFPNGSFKHTDKPQMTISMDDINYQYGKVKCLAGNGFGAVTVEIELVENDEKPSIIEPTYRQVTAIGGQTVMIPCQAVGQPKPRISWLLPNFSTLHSGQSLESVRVDTNGTLVIYNAGPMNDGNYRCNGANNFGMRHRSIEVNIILVPPKIKHKRANAYGELGGTIEIQCESTGVPPPVISWSLPSGAIFPAGRGNGRVEVSENGLLRIEQIAYSDNGDYICRVTNAAGQAEKHVTAIFSTCPKKFSCPYVENL